MDHRSIGPHHQTQITVAAAATTATSPTKLSQQQSPLGSTRNININPTGSNKDYITSSNNTAPIAAGSSSASTSPLNSTNNINNNNSFSLYHQQHHYHQHLPSTPSPSSSSSSASSSATTTPPTYSSPPSSPLLTNTSSFTNSSNHSFHNSQQQQQQGQQQGQQQSIFQKQHYLHPHQQPPHHQHHHFNSLYHSPLVLNTLSPASHCPSPSYPPPLPISLPSPAITSPMSNSTSSSAHPPEVYESSPGVGGTGCDKTKGPVCELCQKGTPSCLTSKSSWATILWVVFYSLKNLHLEQEFFSLKREVYNYVLKHWNILCPNKNRSHKWKKQIQDALSHSKVFISGIQKLGCSGYWKLKSYTDPWKSSRPAELEDGGSNSGNSIMGGFENGGHSDREIVDYNFEQSLLQKRPYDDYEDDEEEDLQQQQQQYIQENRKQQQAFISIKKPRIHVDIPTGSSPSSISPSNSPPTANNSDVGNNTIITINNGNGAASTPLSPTSNNIPPSSSYQQSFNRFSTPNSLRPNSRTTPTATTPNIYGSSHLQSASPRVNFGSNSTSSPSSRSVGNQGGVGDNSSANFSILIKNLASLVGDLHTRLDRIEANLAKDMTAKEEIFMKYHQQIQQQVAHLQQQQQQLQQQQQQNQHEYTTSTTSTTSSTSSATNEPHSLSSSSSSLQQSFSSFNPSLKNNHKSIVANLNRPNEDLKPDHKIHLGSWSGAFETLTSPNEPEAMADPSLHCDDAQLSNPKLQPQRTPISSPPLLINSSSNENIPPIQPRHTSPRIPQQQQQRSSSSSNNNSIVSGQDYNTITITSSLPSSPPSSMPIDDNSNNKTLLNIQRKKVNLLMADSTSYSSSSPSPTNDEEKQQQNINFLLNNS